MRNTTTPTQLSRPSPARSLASNSALRGGNSNSRNPTNNDVQESAEFVVESLRELGFPKEIQASAFIDKVSVQGILEITNFLIQKIDQGSRLENLDDVPPLLRFLKYPSTILQKSQWNVSGVSGGRHLLPIYHWLTQLIMFDTSAVVYPEIGYSEVLDMLRTSYEATSTSSSRDHETLHGICQYMLTSSAMENPSSGTLWEQYSIQETDIDDFLATITRIDPGTIQEVWPIITKFHEHLIWMMGRQVEQNMQKTTEIVCKLRQQRSDMQIMKSNYDSITEKTELIRSDIENLTATMDQLSRETRRLIDDTNDMKAACVTKQQEINSMNNALSNLRRQIADQGISFNEAETIRSDTTNKMRKAEEFQADCQANKMRIAESEAKLREDFKVYSSTWKEFVRIIMTKASTHLPNHEKVYELTHQIQSLLEKSQSKDAGRSLLGREIGFRLDYDSVVAYMSNRDSRRSDGNLMNEILHLDPRDLWDLINELHQAIQHDAVQSLREQIIEAQIQYDIEHSTAEARYNHDVATLTKQQKELDRVMKGNEHLELLKSDREKSMLEEISRSEEKLNHARRKHQAILASEIEDKKREMQELDEYYRKVEFQRQRLEMARAELVTSREQAAQYMERLSTAFRDAIAEVTVSLPPEIVRTFPEHLQQTLDVKPMSAVGTVEVAEVVDGEDICGSSDGEHERENGSWSDGKATDENDDKQVTQIENTDSEDNIVFTKRLHHLIHMFDKMGDEAGESRLFHH